MGRGSVQVVCIKRLFQRGFVDEAGSIVRGNWVVFDGGGFQDANNM